MDTGLTLNAQSDAASSFDLKTPCEPLLAYLVFIASLDGLF